MLTLQTRERRLLLIAAVLAAGVLSYVYLIEPAMVRHREVLELIVARQDLVARQQRLLARQERYAQELETLRGEITERRGRLLPGDKAPLAASELQKLVKSTAQETGVEVRSERILPTTERGRYTEVPVEVTLAGPIRTIVSLIYRLEAAPALLSLSDLKLRVVSIASPRELSATLALTGYIASGPATGAETQPAPGRTESQPRRPGG